MIIDLVASDSDDGSESPREDLVEVADFLNQFQSHFLSFSPKSRNEEKTNNNLLEYNDENSEQTGLGKITTQDLEDALELRSLLERLQLLKQENYVTEEFERHETEYRPLTRRIKCRVSKEIDVLERKIDAVSDRKRLLLTMLRRFEVWTCKLVAQDHLIAPKRLLPELTKSKTGHCCYAPLMNLPSSKYFAELLPPIVKKKKDTTSSSGAATKDTATLGPTTAENTINETVSGEISAFHRKNKCVECCCLPVPPNKHTWKAYARLASMASLIGDEELIDRRDGDRANLRTGEIRLEHRRESSLRDCYKSPVCAYDLNRSKNGRNPSQTSQFSFSPASDFIPLWMRAQRNTQGLRQMILLFEIQRQNEVAKDPHLRQTIDGTRSEENSMDIDNGSRESNKKDANSDFKVIFRGNPTHVKQRVIDTSDHVDQLVEWAVMNQAMFTYHHIKKNIFTARVRKHKQSSSSRKRQREKNDENLSRAEASKRILRGNEFNSQTLFELRQACKSFLLRWFARRNRYAVSLLFSTRIENLTLDIGCASNKKVIYAADALKNIGIISKEYDYIRSLSRRSFYTEDRTFSRIDRRLFTPGRYDGSMSITCESQVLNLLETFSKACPEGWHFQKKIINRAIRDLEFLFGTFSMDSIDKGTKDEVYQTALKMVDVREGYSAEALVELLRNAPAPWVETCAKCRERGSSNNLKTCMNCEQVFHQECSMNGPSPTTVALKEVVESFPPMKDMFKLNRPENLEKPDFSLSESEWIAQTICIERNQTISCKVGKLGIAFIDTEDCVRIFDAIEGDIFSLLDVVRFEDKYEMGNHKLVPANISTKGCLVTHVTNELNGAKAGLCVGDIITDVTVEEYTDANNMKHKGVKRFDLSTVSSKHRTKILQINSSKLNLEILRAPGKIVDCATRWYSGVKKENKTMLDILRGFDRLEFWYCGACSSQPQASTESKSVLWEATRCRAVIRRIGMESYSHPFREGNEDDNSDYFSLRRLDSMMTHIIKTASKDIVFDIGGDSFFIPDFEGSPRRRLPWAPEGLERKPMALLCAAMENLINASPSRGGKTNRNALIRHFITTFSAWCLGNSSNGLANPPSFFRHLRSPWFKSTCPVCFSRPVESGDSCDNNQCVRALSRRNTIECHLNDTEIEAAQRDVKEYSKRASLVGTSFFVCPNDPLVEKVAQIVRVDHQARPVEFVVASYVPSECCDVVVNGRQLDKYDKVDETEGIYHLLPVVSAQQQLFLLQRCATRKFQQQSGNDLLSWLSLDVLNLDGVVRYSPAALDKKMKETKAMYIAIENSIKEGVRTSFSDSAHLTSDSKSSTSLTSERTKSSSRVSIFRDFRSQTELLSNILKGKVASEVMRELVKGPLETFDFFTEEEKKGHSYWKIVQSKGCAADDMVFGTSLLHRGLIAVNSYGTSFRILTLPHVEENEYQFYYSDFLFRDDKEKCDMIKTLSPEAVNSPMRVRKHDSFVRKALVFSHPDSNGIDPKICFWGFEIVKWRNDKFLRVGRIQHGSVASRVGLKTHDVIESINGLRFNCFPDICTLVASILGGCNIKVRLPADLHRNEEISILVSTITNLRTSLSPVQFTIARPTTHVRTAEGSETAILGSNHQKESSVQSHHISGPSHRNIEAHNSLQQNRTQPTPKLNANNLDSIRMISPKKKHSYQSYALELPQDAVTTYHPLRTQNEQSAPHYPESAARVNSHSIVSGFLQTLSSTFDCRPRFNLLDLYRPAGEVIVFTAMETSVYLHAWIAGMPKLGMRLLMPRYSVDIISKQVKLILHWSQEQLLRIPVIEESAFKMLLNLDFERMSCTSYPETGPFIFDELHNGVHYKYRRPIRSLPIDRTIERWFNSTEDRNRCENLPLPSNDFVLPQNPDTENWFEHTDQVDEWTTRIRGGGNDSIGNITRKEIDAYAIDGQNNDALLCDIPQRYWKGRAVYTFVQSAKKAIACDVLLVGFVTRNATASGKAEVDIIYAARTGYFEDPKRLEFESDDVWVVDIDGKSEEAKVIARVWAEGRAPVDYDENLQRSSTRNLDSSKQFSACEKSVLHIESISDPSTTIHQSRVPACTMKAMELSVDSTVYAYACETCTFHLESSVEGRTSFFDCSLCSLPFERYLPCTDLGKNISKCRSKHASLGCTLLSDVALGASQSCPLENLPGALGEAKSMLLRTVGAIPDFLKLSWKDLKDQRDNLKFSSVFDRERDIEQWKRFVRDCTSSRMLAQAFVALGGSIEKSKMPRWWRSKSEGWSTPYMVMTEACESSLYLHIYVFDLAISEVISRSLTKSSFRRPASNESNVATTEKMKKYWKLAMRIGYTPNDGTNHEYCYHCNEGGHLLCCELCPNVQHHECCDPVIAPDIELDHWICDSCLNDIENFESLTEENNEESDDDDEHFLST